jgi:hypothetical protein
MWARRDGNGSGTASATGARRPGGPLDSASVTCAGDRLDGSNSDERLCGRSRRPKRRRAGPRTTLQRVQWTRGRVRWALGVRDPAGGGAGPREPGVARGGRGRVRQGPAAGRVMDSEVERAVRLAGEELDRSWIRYGRVERWRAHGSVRWLVPGFRRGPQSGSHGAVSNAPLRFRTVTFRQYGSKPRRVAISHALPAGPPRSNTKSVYPRGLRGLT